MTTRLIQTRVPAAHASWLEERARKEGGTIASVLRRIVATAKEVDSDRFEHLERRVLELELALLRTR